MRIFTLLRPLASNYAGLRAFFLASALMLIPLCAVPSAAQAAIQMETGDQRLRLDREEVSVESESRASPQRDEEALMQTAPRAKPDKAGAPELPYGVTPEVYVPWPPPGQGRERSSPPFGNKAGGNAPHAPSRPLPPNFLP